MNYDMVSADYARLPVKPVVDGEARYEEEDGTTPFQVRRAGYWACFAGGFYSYGHRDNWMSPQTWRTWEDTPGTKQMKVMGDLFRSIEWWQSGSGSVHLFDWIKGDVAARSSRRRLDTGLFDGQVFGKRQAVGYHRFGHGFGLVGGPADRRQNGHWIFPTSRTKEFTPPSGWQDAVLLIKKESK